MNPDESTPLITITPPAARLPYITPVVERLRAQQVQSPGKDDILALSPTAASLDSNEQTAFILVVLLQLRRKEQTPLPSNLWDRWTRERTMRLNAERLDTAAFTIWSQFVENWCTDQALVSTILMTRFASDETQHHSSIKLLDLLNDDHSLAPKQLLSHRLLELAVYRLWTAGHSEPIASDASVLLRVLYTLKRFSTPRVLHAADLIMYLSYSILLAHFATYPPVASRMSPPFLGLREIVIIVCSLASILRPPVALRIPHMLVFVSFVMNFPHCPLPGSFPHDMMLCAFILLLIQLHIPHTPSPIFLFRPDYIIPFSTLLWSGFKRTIRPSLLFFLPVSVVSTYLLSLSLAGNFLHDFRFIKSGLLTPIETRTGFLALWFAVLFMFLNSLVITNLNAPVPTTISNWDRFGPQVGHESRIDFIYAVSKYSEPYFFPLPFNFSSLILAQFPTTVSRLFRKTDRHPIFSSLERLLWIIAVLPISMLVAGIWLWGCL